jgi:hypothetical protein
MKQTSDEDGDPSQIVAVEAAELGEQPAIDHLGYDLT